MLSPALWKQKITWSGTTRPYFTNDKQSLIAGAGEDLFWMMADAIFGVIVLDPPFTVRPTWHDGANDAVLYARRNDLFRLLKPGGILLALTNPVHGLLVVPKDGIPEWFSTPELEHKPLGIHPTARPVTALKEILATTEGMIFDPFAGSGSTLLAAQELQREALGIEIDERYCALAAGLLHFGKVL